MMRPGRRLAWLALTTGVVVGAQMAVSSPARACGGTFCDAGTQPMPVPQSGETIVFAMGDGLVEAHIQIEVDPDVPPEKFAWIIPIPAVPELEVGSEPFVGALAAATSRIHRVDFSPQSCPSCPNDPPPDDCCSTFGSSDGGADGCGSFLGCDDLPATPALPDVVLEERVGVFEAVVLSGGTIDGVMTWLADNGYQQDTAAEPILAEYLDEGQLFLALKLRPRPEGEAVHPIVIRYEGDTPCIPIRLTRIAAEADMPIRAIFLDDGRYAPSNWLHVEPNPIAVDWTTTGGGFEDLVTLAVDDAGGHAWVTEMADDTPIIPQASYLGVNWDAEVFEELPLEDLPTLLWNQGYVTCAICDLWPPPVEGVLTEHLRLPDGMDLGAYLPQMLDERAVPPEIADVAIWDGPGFAAALRERVIDPALHADELLSTRPFTTRLITTMSPHEMTEDPMFQRSDWMQDQPVIVSAERRQWCHGWTTWTLPGDIEVSLPTQEGWDTMGWPASMPFAARIERVPPAGPPMVLQDNFELLRTTAALRTERERYPGAWPGGAYCEDDPMMGPPMDGGDSDGDGDGAGASGSPANASGCACDLSGPEPRDRSVPTALAALGLLVWRRRRLSRGRTSTPR